VSVQHGQTCILVPTFQLHLPAAQLTLRLIDRFWPDHPESFICGVTRAGPKAIPLEEDPADWMAVLRGAASYLSSRGFQTVYLILDDQGPLDRCHDRHLNETIPRWMSELNASYISIRGWDHRRNSSGRSMGRRYLWLQRQLPQYPWRFALHPALWRLDVLIALLDILLADSGPERHTAWAFEADAGRLRDQIDPAWNDSTYRVCGRAMMATPMPAVERYFRHVVDGAARRADRTLDRISFQRGAWPPTVTRAVRWVLQNEAVYYQGPYPMPFSGFLVKGRMNPFLPSFLRKRGRDQLLREIEITVPKVSNEHGTTRSVSGNVSSSGAELP
jgi:hypothetical protein